MLIHIFHIFYKGVKIQNHSFSSWILIIFSLRSDDFYWLSLRSKNFDLLRFINSDKDWFIGSMIDFWYNFRNDFYHPPYFLSPQMENRKETQNNLLSPEKPLPTFVKKMKNEQSLKKGQWRNFPRKMKKFWIY